MKRIDTERHKPDPANPNRLVYDGQRTAQEIFAELRYRLESAGYLPDEYFMLDRDWDNGRAWPEDGDIFCTVDYGGIEGIYLDIYMKYQDEQNKTQTKSFATGKTLGEADEDMDRMFLIASAVTKAFHSDGLHARYVQVGEQDQTPAQSAVIHLNPEEKKIVTDSLIDTRARRKAENKPFEKVEQLLRRIIGSITEYVRAVGERPKTLDDFDRASLAIADGNLDEFNDALPKIPYAYGSLLRQASARPDATGFIMTERLCREAADINSDIFLQSCKNAVNVSDTDRVRMMMAMAPNCAPDLKQGFYGELILHALNHDEKHGGTKSHVAEQIAACCTPEQIWQADPFLLKLSIMQGNRELTKILLDKGMPVHYESAMLLYAAAQKKDVALADRLIQAGADVNGQNHAALRACMNINDLPSAMFLLKCGADFRRFQSEIVRENAGPKNLDEQKAGFMFALKSFWQNNLEPPARDQSDDDEEVEDSEEAEDSEDAEYGED